MLTLSELANLIPITEAKGDEKAWSPTLTGKEISKHLSMAQVRGILSDEDYGSSIKHDSHIPVFRVKKLPGNIKEVKVGNTGGSHHVHYHITNQGKVTKKTVFRKESGLHPKMNWAIQSQWSIEDEGNKGKK